MRVISRTGRYVNGRVSGHRGGRFKRLPRPVIQLYRPDGMSRADWLAAMEEKARDPRFGLMERDAEISHYMIVPLKR